jgi:hypothetical protein
MSLLDLAQSRVGGELLHLGGRLAAASVLVVVVVSAPDEQRAEDQGD